MPKKTIGRSFPMMPAALLRRVALAWLSAVTVEYLLLPEQLRDLSALDGTAQMSPTRIAAVACGVFLLLLALAFRFRTERVERACLAAVFAVLAFTALRASFTTAFLGICLLALAAVIVFAVFGWDHTPEPLPPEPAREKKCFRRVMFALCGVFFLFAAAWTVGRVYSFCTPSYDFGIFAQMFYSMKTNGLPLTTLERDGLLSHFAVHVSPIYYLLLPFYCLVPTPATLQVLQAAVVASAVIPLWKICRRHGIVQWQRVLLCTLLLLYPAYCGGTSYDIHENCFLTPLLLWLFYGIDRGNTPLTALAAGLTLLVKEDAAVYVAVVGLWQLVRTLLHWQARRSLRDLLTALALLAGSLGWFYLVTDYLAQSGDGVMTYRYRNFMFDGSSSLLTVVKAVLRNPMKAVYECVDPEKLRFLALTMLPLLGLPLLTRRFERYLLLIPYVLVNLMSDYQYQHDIFFQYTFGSTAFLLYATVVNLADLAPQRWRMTALVCAVAVSAVCFATTVLPVGLRYPTMAVQYSAYYQRIRDALDTVPQDASVAATTFYTTELSQRDTLYDIRYCTQAHLLETDYVVVSLSGKADCSRYATQGKENGVENLIAMLEKKGYTLYNTVENVLVIYQKPVA